MTRGSLKTPNWMTTGENSSGSGSQLYAIRGSLRLPPVSATGLNTTSSHSLPRSYPPRLSTGEKLRASLNSYGYKWLTKKKPVLSLQTALQ